jgi:hypothetical protein
LILPTWSTAFWGGHRRPVAPVDYRVARKIRRLDRRADSSVLNPIPLFVFELNPQCDIVTNHLPDFSHRLTMSEQSNLRHGSIPNPIRSQHVDSRCTGIPLVSMIHTSLGL